MSSHVPIHAAVLGAFVSLTFECSTDKRPFLSNHSVQTEAPFRPAKTRKVVPWGVKLNGELQTAGSESAGFERNEVKGASERPIMTSPDVDMQNLSLHLAGACVTPEEATGSQGTHVTRVTHG